MENKTNPVILLLIAIGLFGVGYYIGGMNMKVKLLENKGSGTAQLTGGGTAAPAEDPLSRDNLKKYAKELKLDQKKLEKCLDDKKYADWIKASTSYGQEVGVLGTPNFYINGRLLGGAFPLENFKEIIDKELAGEGSNEATAYSQQLQEAAKMTPPAFVPEPKTIEIKNDTPVKGGKEAKVTIVEFSDPSCPYCVRASLTIKQLLGEYKDKIKLAFYYFPGHGTGEEAMKAMLCAGDENKFWEMHDKVFSANAKAMGL